MVALVLAGAVLASAVVLTHGRPLGLALGVVATVAAACALPGGWTSRFAFTAGWALLLAYVLAPRSGGGYLVAASGPGYVVLALGLGLVLFGIITVRPLRPPPES